MNPASVLQHLLATEQRLPSDWILWEPIRDDVEAYFDQSGSPWSIDDEVLGTQSLAINFFFPLRNDLHGLSRLVGLLCGHNLVVGGFDLICRGRAAMNAPPFDVAAYARDLDGSSMLLLMTCMPAIGRETAVAAAAQPGGRPRFEAKPDERARDLRLAALGRAQRLVDDLERQRIVDRAVFAVIYDNRDLSLAEACGVWHRMRDRDGRFHAWSYQQVLALSGSMLPDIPGWRSFLRDRYGIVAIGARSSSAQTAAPSECERRSA
jgi:hypothetical protein